LPEIRSELSFYVQIRKKPDIVRIVVYVFTSDPSQIDAQKEGGKK